MSLIDFSEQSRANPLEVVERMASTNDWSFERAGEDEITILVRGKWTDYQVSFTWMYDIEALHLACAFEFKVPERCARRGAAAHLDDQRAVVGRAFRSVDEGRPDHVPPRAGAGRRRERVRPAMRGACWRPRSTPASAISRPSSSWSGPARARARRSTPRCSRPPARRRPRRLVMPHARACHPAARAQRVSHPVNSWLSHFETRFDCIRMRLRGSMTRETSP